jgi:hypothetical protein
VAEALGDGVGNGVVPALVVGEAVAEAPAVGDRLALDDWLGLGSSVGRG